MPTPIVAAIAKGLGTVTPWGWVALGTVYLLSAAAAHNRETKAAERIELERLRLLAQGRGMVPGTTRVPSPVRSTDSWQF
jgi:hypothetical protein